MYDKAAVQDISLPESHPFGCRLHAENCSEIKGKSNSAAHQATVRHQFYKPKCQQRSYCTKAVVTRIYLQFSWERRR